MTNHPLAVEAPAQRGERYLTLRDVSAKLGGRSRSAIYADIAAKRLPQPLKLGGRIYWPEGALDDFLRNTSGEAA